MNPDEPYGGNWPYTHAIWVMWVRMWRQLRQNLRDLRR